MCLNGCYLQLETTECYFTVAANGLPRFASAVDSAHVILLDDTHTLRIAFVVLGRVARPDLPDHNPTALEIQSTILKLARLNNENCAFYSGLIRVRCTAMRFERLEDNNTILDGFVQH
ncbi:hypothetical protein GJ496_003940 [Pomphorhynchus laevis]|nr:hypothetical protein GJ496_003940 [Pomphorhynchus laevis]